MKNILLYFILVFIMEGVFSDIVFVSVKEGDSVTLSPQLEIKEGDVIDWRFEGNLIARIRTNNPSVYNDVLGGKYKDRLKVEGRTGNLTITNFRKDDAGVYEVSNSINTIKRSFSVSVSSGLSGGAIAGIVAGVVGGVLAVVAAVVGIFYKKKSGVL